MFSRGFSSRAVKAPGNVYFPNPVHTKTAHPQKNDSRGNCSRVSCVHGITKREQHVRFRIFVDGGKGIGPVSGPCILYRYLYVSFCVYVLFWCCPVFEEAGAVCCGGCIAGFLSNRSRLLDARCPCRFVKRLLSSFGMWNNVPSNNVRTCFGLLSFCYCCCYAVTMKRLQPTQKVYIKHSACRRSGYY